LVRRKNTFEKKRSLLGFAGSPGSLVDLTGWPDFARFLPRLIFYLTRTGLAIGSFGSRINPSGRSRFNNYWWYNQDNRVYYKLKYLKIKNNITMKKNLKYLIFSHSSFTFQKVRMKNNNTELKNKNKNKIFFIFLNRQDWIIRRM
jgi:hypothetical protein